MYIITILIKKLIHYYNIGRVQHIIILFYSIIILVINQNNNN